MSHIRIVAEDKVSGQSVYSFWKFLADNGQEDSKNESAGSRVSHQVQEYEDISHRKTERGA